MKQALVFGCASTNGKTIIDVLIQNDYRVINIGSTKFDHPLVDNRVIEWNNIDITYIQKTLPKLTGNIDFLFFNQNSSSLNQTDFNLQNTDTLKVWKLIKNWSHSNWLSCQLPFLVTHTVRHKLTSETKVGWMLSSFIDKTMQDVHVYPDYSSFKYFNYMAMQCFANENKIKTFGIFPDFNKENSKLILNKIMTEILDNKFETKKEFYFYNYS